MHEPVRPSVGSLFLLRPMAPLQARLPVYRLVVLSDPAIRYYLDTVSGALLMKVDHGARAS